MWCKPQNPERVKVSKAKISFRRKIVFSLVILFVFLVIATAGLLVLEENKIIDTKRQDDIVTHSPTNLLETINVGGKKMFEIMNPDRPDPLMVHRILPVEKPVKGLRMLVVGASFAQGDPYVDPAQNALGFGGIPDWVEAELSQRFPSLEIEIVNAAFGGTNSQGVLTVVKELMVIQPDILMVLCGNNEGYVPKTPFNQPLHDWILYRALKKAVIPDPEKDERPLFHPQDDDNQKIEENYQANILKMIEIANRAGAKVMLGTLPVNLKFLGRIPDSDSVTHMYPTDDPIILKGRDLISQEKFDQAIKELSKSKNSSYAARFMAEAFEGKGEYEKALGLYKLSVQANPKGRMRPSFIKFIRRTCKSGKAVLVDLEKKIETESPNGITSSDFFLDNCHLTWKGYYLCAQEVIRVLLEHRMIQGAGSGEPKPAPDKDEIIGNMEWEKIRTYEPKIWIEGGFQNYPEVQPPDAKLKRGANF